MKRTIVTTYDPAWPAQFQNLRDKIWPCISDVAIRIEHVGSTSAPGLAAKPVIDMDVVIASLNELPVIVQRLAELGYEHRGNLGIEGREAFRAPQRVEIPHHLYACVAGSLALQNHILLRDHPRTHLADAQAFSVLKERLASQFPTDIDRYIEGRSSFILEILRHNGLGLEEAAAIESANRAAAGKASIDPL